MFYPHTTGFDLANMSCWHQGAITYKTKQVPVLFVPNGRGKLAVDALTFKPYWYDRARKLWKQSTYGGFYALRRTFRHVEASHQREIPTMEHLQRLCEDCGVDFVDLKTDDVGRTWEKNARWVKDVDRKLAQGIQTLGPIIDPDKIDGRRQINTILILNFRDSIGRVNQGVILARTAKAARKFRQRIKNIRAMDAWMVYYGMVVESLILSLEYHLKEAYTILHQLKYRLLAQGMQAYPTKRIKADFERYREHLEHLKQRPYYRNMLHRLQEAAVIESIVEFGDERVIAAVPTVDISLAGLTVLKIRGPLDRMKIHLDRWRSGKPVNQQVHKQIEKALQEQRQNLTMVNLDQLPASREGGKTLREVIEELLVLIEKAIEGVKSDDWTTAYINVDACLNRV